MQLPSDIATTVSAAILEDLGDGDKTAALVPNTPATARVISRESGVLCGQPWFNEVFRQIDASVVITWHIRDGEVLQPDSLICELSGPARALLSGERTALNFLQTLSGTASVTAEYVNAVKHTKTKILDTRKTIPGLRTAQKYATLCGGGMNHRMGLFDAILIKENHIVAAGSIHAAIANAKQMFPGIKIEVEVETLDQLGQALAATPDVIMLDNFTLEQMQQAVNITQGAIPLEVSGNVDRQSLSAVAEVGVDYVSIGAITKHIRAIDLSMRIQH